MYHLCLSLVHRDKMGIQNNCGGFRIILEVVKGKVELGLPPLPTCQGASFHSKEETGIRARREKNRRSWSICDSEPRVREREQKGAAKSSRWKPSIQATG